MSVTRNLKLVRDMLATAAVKLDRPVPKLVAVSKTKAAELVLAAYNEGQRDFGENYVQEIAEKAPLLPADIRWHFIGHLQTNKVKKLLSIPNLYIVESVDNFKLASEIQKVYASQPRPSKLKVLVQVNTSREVQKSGIEPEECNSLVQHIIKECPNLELSGLMTIGKLENTPEDQEKCFRCLRECREALPPEIGTAQDFIMSMGMSGDFEAALREGSTHVRIGQAIFGARNTQIEGK